jgi:hypothetical protein
VWYIFFRQLIKLILGAVDDRLDRYMGQGAPEKLIEVYCRNKKKRVAEVSNHAIHKN